MQFPSALARGTLVQRYKRFLADVRLDESGEVVTAHCANPGSMKTCLEPGTRCWLSPAREGRKLPYTWEIAELPAREGDGGTLVYVNPAGANALVEEAVRAERVPELVGYPTLRREVKYGASSRIDLLLERGAERCFVEVKNVTLALGAGRSAFPDSVTARGTKHLEELSRVVEAGGRGVLFFCASRGDAQSVEPADAIDPVYGRALRDALRRGVEILAYATRIDASGVELSHPLPVVLP